MSGIVPVPRLLLVAGPITTYQSAFLLFLEKYASDFLVGSVRVETLFSSRSR